MEPLASKTRINHSLGFLGEHLDEYENPLSDPNTRDYVARDYKQYLKQHLDSRPRTVNSYLTAIESLYTYLGLGKAKVKQEELPKLAPRVPMLLPGSVDFCLKD